MPASSILVLFFSTVAVIIATLTGLIGAFSTFRLQNIYNELAALIEAIRIRQTPAGSLDEWIERHDYGLIERIYDTSPQALDALRSALDQSGLTSQHIGYEYDYTNVVGNHTRYWAVKRINQRNFRLALLYVFISLVLPVCTNALLLLTSFALLSFLGLYLGAAALIFLLFMRQLNMMTVES